LQNLPLREVFLCPDGNGRG